MQTVHAHVKRLDKKKSEVSQVQVHTTVRDPFSGQKTMAAVVIVKRHLNGVQETDINTADDGTESFVENLPPSEVREKDTVMGTLILG